MDIETNLKNADRKMHKTIESYKKMLSSVRTGRASLGMVSHIKAECYGSKMPIDQVARVSVGPPRMLVIEAWDLNTVTPIVKAIQISDLGITPQVDGQIIRLNVPPLNMQRRKDMVRMVKVKVEEAKVSVRNIRRDTIESLRSAQKSGESSEDELRRAQARLQGITDSVVSKLNKLTTDKETEIMST